MANELELQNTIQLEHSQTIFGIDFHQFSVSFVVADFPEDADAQNRVGGAVDTLRRLATALDEAGWEFQAGQLRRAAKQFAENR